MTLTQLLTAATATVVLMGSLKATAMTTPSTPTTFQKLAQPWPLKLGVTIAGGLLIGAELWWFFGNRPKVQTAEAIQGFQRVKITVDGGYEPSHVMVKAGQPVQLEFLRRDPSRCLETVLIPEFQISQNLALNQITTIEFTPTASGEYPFTCGMNMFRGVIEVR